MSRSSGAGTKFTIFNRAAFAFFGYVEFRGSLDLSPDRESSGPLARDHLDGVTVVWGRRPISRSRLRGWLVSECHRLFVDATETQLPPSAVDPRKPSKLCWWSIQAKATDALLVLK